MFNAAVFKAGTKLKKKNYGLAVNKGLASMQLTAN